MASFDEIRSNLHKMPDEGMRVVCTRIVDEVASRISRANQGVWTYGTFSQWTGKAPTDSLLNTCIQILATQEDLHLLNMHFMYFSASDPEAEGVQISDEEVADAISSGYLVDPKSGDEIRSFTECLVPYFEPNPRLRIAE